MQVKTDLKTPNFIRPEILLHPNIPKPLHGLNPRTIKGQEWWDEQRHIAYDKNNDCCWACGVHKSKAEYYQWLEAHEYYEYRYKEGEAKLVEIVALCHACHNYIHSGRMAMMQENGTMEQEKVANILEHGNKILSDAGLLHLKTNLPESEFAEWKKWHLVIDGVSYYTKFESFNEWYQFYQSKNDGEI